MSPDWDVTVSICVIWPSYYQIVLLIEDLICNEAVKSRTGETEDEDEDEDED